MSLLVDLQLVPQRILDRVRAAVLQNREALRHGGTRSRVVQATKQRPQFTKVGATMRDYVAPVPIATSSPNPEKLGLAWVMDWPGSRDRFRAHTLWRMVYRDRPYIDENDSLHIKVGSGDGTQWVEASLSLPGVQAFRSQVEGAFAGRRLVVYETDFTESEDPPDILRVRLLSAEYPYEAYTTGLIPPGGTSHSPGVEQGDWREVWQSFTDSSSFFYIGLPVGDGSAVVVCYARAAGAWQGFGRQVATVEDMALTIQRATFTGQQDKGPFTVAATDVAAFYVTRTTCKQIAVPTELRAALDEMMPPVAFEAESSWIYQYTGEWPTSTPPTYPSGYQLRTMPAPSAGDKEVQVTYQTSVPVQYQGTMMVSADATFAQSTFDVIPWSFGADPGGMDNGERSSYLHADSASPAVYLPLTQPDAMQAQAFDGTTVSYPANNAETLALIAALGAPAPKGLVAVDKRDAEIVDLFTKLDEGQPGYNPETSLSPLYEDPDRVLTRIPMASHPFPGDEDPYPIPQDSTSWKVITGANISLALDPSRVNPTEILPEGEASVVLRYVASLIHTNWGKPGFCRQKIQELGFTAEDLTP